MQRLVIVILMGSEGTGHVEGELANVAMEYDHGTGVGSVAILVAVESLHENIISKVLAVGHLAVGGRRTGWSVGAEVLKFLTGHIRQIAGWNDASSGSANNSKFCLNLCHSDGWEVLRQVRVHDSICDDEDNAWLGIGCKPDPSASWTVIFKADA